MVIASTIEGLGLDPLEMPAVLVASHGPFTWGRDAEHAAENAIALEAVAAMAVGTIALNPDVEPVARYVLDRHCDRKHGSGTYYGQGGGRTAAKR